MTKVVATAAACITTWLGVALVMWAAGAETAEQWRGALGQPHGARFVYLALALSLPALASRWVVSRLARSGVDGPTRARIARLWQWIRWPVVAGYVVTAAFGCPAVHNSLGRSMLSGRAELGMLPRCLPELDTYVAVPLLPGLVLSYVEAGDGCGTVGGGFLVHLWDGGAVRQLATFPLWGGP